MSIDLVGGKGLALLPDTIKSGAGGQYCKEMHVSRCMSVVSVYLCLRACCMCGVSMCVSVLCTSFCTALNSVVHDTIKSSAEMRVFCCISVVRAYLCRRVCSGVSVFMCLFVCCPTPLREMWGDSIVRRLTCHVRHAAACMSTVGVGLCACVLVHVSVGVCLCDCVPVWWCDCVLCLCDCVLVCLCFCVVV